MLGRRAQARGFRAALRMSVATSLVLALVYPSYWLLALIIFLTTLLLVVLCMLNVRQTIFGANISRLPAAAAAQNHIALTIDDGPHPEVTPAVLAFLQQHGLKATFFCPGTQAQLHPQLIHSICAQGHEVANHSEDHRWYFSLLPFWLMRRNIERAQEILTELTGQRPRFFRPIAGIVAPPLEPQLARLDLQLVSWGRRAFDARSNTVQRAWARLSDGLQAGDILLLHDGNAGTAETGRPLILELLPMLGEVIEQRKMKTVTLSEAFPPYHK